MKVGVIIGRFQVAELHKGHKKLLSEALAASDEVLVLLGVAPIPYTKENPLDYEARRIMIQEHFERIGVYNYQILPLLDVQDDAKWSSNVDSLIYTLYPNETISLFGSRESFLPYYSGKYSKEVVEAMSGVSGTEDRKNLRNAPVQSVASRRALIKGIMNQYPKVFATVDIAIVRKTVGTGQNAVLLGRKPNETEFRFVGGFSDPTDVSFEAAAKREAYEETGLEVHDLKCLGSFKIDDWRYRHTTDKIITTFFVGNNPFGAAKADDDIAEVKWVLFTDFEKVAIVKTHAPLRQAFIDYIKREGKN